MNLHAIANGLISAVHPNETVTLYRATGQMNVRGEIKAVYAAGEAVKAQIQSEGDDALAHSDAVASRVGQNETNRRFYLLAANQADKPAGLVRPLARSGDLLQRQDETWWLITALTEDFSAAGWVAVRATLQVKAPEGPPL
ncbi:MAG: hypothetical protein LBS31_05070 [Candidatus Adiutrix sp.]|jgi:hypothetical protein|nr:hypothetical protein [Candidatus Adiutrix sp.]